MRLGTDIGLKDIKDRECIRMDIITCELTCNFVVFGVPFLIYIYVIVLSESGDGMLYVAGNKVNNIDVVYTPWANLKKTPSMDVGQVGFHNNKAVSLLYFQNIYVHDLFCFSRENFICFILVHLVVCSGAHCESGKANK